MPVKNLILLVVYLLVPLACIFAKEKTICQEIASDKKLTFIEWRSALKKEGLKKFWKQISWCKVKSLKPWSTLACIFSYIEEEKVKNKIKVHKIYQYN